MVSRKTQTAVQGAAAALAALGAAETALAGGGRALIVDDVARVVVDCSPRQVVDLTVKVLGAGDKPLTRLGVITGVAAIGAGTALTRGPARLLPPLANVAAATFAASLHPPRTPFVSGSAAGVAMLGGLSLMGRPETPARPGRTAALALAGLIGLRAARHLTDRGIRRFDLSNREALGPVEAPDLTDGAEDWAGISPVHVAAEDFYATDVATNLPRIDPESWSLTVMGLVDTPVQVGLADLRRESQDLDAVLVCIHNQPGGDRVGNARWQVVPLAALLERAGVDPGAKAIRARAVDGFDVTIPFEALRDRPAYVVVGMNGLPLKAAHGHPVRLFAPGLHGQYAAVKWLTSLELVADVPKDFWNRRGWPQRVSAVHPHARIDSPAGGRRARTGTGPTDVVGVAWAPPHGVATVETSLDGGPWVEAELAKDLGPTSWRRWRAGHDLSPGVHRIRARAAGVDGSRQVERRSAPFPQGAGGLHEVRFVAS